jgi:hypothetical protein
VARRTHRAHHNGDDLVNSHTHSGHLVVAQRNRASQMRCCRQSARAHSWIVCRAYSPHTLQYSTPRIRLLLVSQCSDLCARRRSPIVDVVSHRWAWRNPSVLSSDADWPKASSSLPLRSAYFVAAERAPRR